MSGFRGMGGDGPNRGRGGNAGGGRGRGRGRGSKNPYWYFVEEIRAQKRLGSWEQASKEASPLWENLDKNTRQKYVDMAKDHRNNQEKLTSVGISVSSILKEQEAMRRIEEQQNTWIENFVKNKSCDIAEKEFFAIHANHYCSTNAGTFQICEIAIVNFSLGKGILSEFHTLVHSEIPLGYHYDAKLKSEEIGVPLPPLEDSAKDPIFLISQIMSYLEVSPRNNIDSSLPPLYAMPDDRKCIRKFLEELCSLADRPLDTFKVYPIPKLFYELSNNINENNLPHLCIAQDQLKKDTFTYSRGISCEMHEKGDYFPKCSLSIAKRMCFTICDLCCKLLNINVIPGCHIPAPIYVSSTNDRNSSRVSSRYSGSVHNDSNSQSYRDNDSASSMSQDDGWTVCKSKRKH